MRYFGKVNCDQSIVPFWESFVLFWTLFRVAVSSKFALALTLDQRNSEQNLSLSCLWFIARLWGGFAKNAYFFEWPLSHFVFFLSSVPGPLRLRSSPDTSHNPYGHILHEPEAPSANKIQIYFRCSLESGPAWNPSPIACPHQAASSLKPLPMCFGVQSN